RLVIMEKDRAHKDLTKALQAGKEALAKYPTDPSVRSSQALLMADNGQTDEAVKLLRSQLTRADADRETYVSIAQVYELGKRYREGEDAAHTAEAMPGQPRENINVWTVLGGIYEHQKLYDRADEQFKKVLAVDTKNSYVLNYYGCMLADLG